MWKMRRVAGSLAESPSCTNPQKDRLDDPSNHRPISLLSQVRKIVEKAIDMLIRKSHPFHELQLGFQKGKSTETAILRATELQRRGQRCIAVLDLNQPMTPFQDGIYAISSARCFPRRRVSDGGSFHVSIVGIHNWRPREELVRSR